jgi:hypothetical protein
MAATQPHPAPSADFEWQVRAFARLHGAVDQRPSGPARHRWIRRGNARFNEIDEEQDHGGLAQRN